MSMGYIREIVMAHEEDFTRLLNAYNNLRGGLIIRRCNKVFYSETEEYYYDRNMKEDLMRNYGDLYEKYVIARHPENRELQLLKRIVGPLFLEEILAGKIERGYYLMVPANY